ncbi:MAG: hypothetical protein ACI3VS_05625 [Evtepia sp.]
MKKKETKAGRNKPPEVRTREQLEDQAFNRMLLWLAAAAVVEVVMLLVNRYYIHARVEELGALPVLYNILGAGLIAGIVLFVLFLLWGYRIRQKGEGKDGILQFILSAVFLCIGIGGFLMRNYSTAAAPAVLGVVPGLAVLMLVFYLYQKEFFGCAIAGGLGILGLWLFRATGGRTYYGYLVVALIIVVALAALALTLKKKDGALTLRGKDVTVLQPGAAYAAYYLTAVITAVLLLAPLALGTAVAYYAIWVMAAWLFILAVYFTAKLM